jgi:hypothetical protein
LRKDHYKIYIYYLYSCYFSPNPGFEEQLELFENMGNTVDVESQAYKMYRLEKLAQKVQLGMWYLCPVSLYWLGLSKDSKY